MIFIAKDKGREADYVHVNKWMAYSNNCVNAMVPYPDGEKFELEIDLKDVAEKRGIKFIRYYLIDVPDNELYNLLLSFKDYEIACHATFDCNRYCISFYNCVNKIFIYEPIIQWYAKRYCKKGEDYFEYYYKKNELDKLISTIKAANNNE